MNRLPSVASGTACLLLLSALPTPAQDRIGTANVMDVYREHCASCHGADLAGGLGGSLLEGPYQHGSSAEDMTRIIRDGLVSLGMPAYGETLSEKDIRALVIFTLEKRAAHEAQPPAVDVAAWKPDTVFSAGETKFRLETVAEGDSEFWGIDFLPDGRAIVTQRTGELRILESDGKLSPPIKNSPEVWFSGQGGLLDVGVHPEYAENGWIYLSYSESDDKPGEEAAAMTTVVRGRIKDGAWTDEEIIFRAKPEDFIPSAHHYGSRFVFLDGYLYFAIGDRGRQDMAQDLSKPNGKIHRVHDDGRIPEDNPFVSDPNAYPSIWTYGNRNPQGLALRPGTKEIWETEHGPRGGDELNLIKKGANYGWPVITFGMNYDGTPITEKTAAPGMEQPELYWVPSLGVCGVTFYDGDKFPAWNGHLLVNGLATQDLRLVTLDGQTVTGQEVLFARLGRMRDATTGPDGYPYALLSTPDGNPRNPGKIVRLVPVD